MLNLVNKYKLNRCISAGFTPPSQSFSNVRMRCDMPFSVLDSSCPDAFIGVKCLCNTLLIGVAAVLVTATWQAPADASVSCLQFMDEWSNCVFMLA